MNLLDWAYYKLVMSNYKDFDTVPDVKKWNNFLSSLDEPNDYIDKAYNKYLCKKYYFSKKKLFISRVICGFGMFIGDIFLKFPIKDNSNALSEDKILIEVIKDINPNEIVPNKLVKKYPKRIYSKYSNKYLGRMNQTAKNILLSCRNRYPKDVFFHFLIYKELVKHSHFIKKYDPSATLVYASERNIASPIITEFYERNNRKFISFMHGDYILQMNQAFMQFSEYYVWDEAYINMFVHDLHCDDKQFIVYTPKKLMKKWNLEIITPEYFCTYYFTGCSKKSVKIVAEAFNKLKASGKKCKVRLHPRWSVNDTLIKELFKEFFIEEAKNISMEESLGNTQYAIGLNSTVLHEAFVEGRKVVIDDISSPDDFNSLVDRRYIMLKKEHILFSELLKMDGEKREVII